MGLRWYDFAPCLSLYEVQYLSNVFSYIQLISYKCFLEYSYSSIETQVEDYGHWIPQDPAEKYRK
jgi:hypothetical protein